MASERKRRASAERLALILCSHAERGDVDAINNMCSEKGTSFLEVQCAKNWFYCITPLCSASCRGRVGVIRELLRLRANINSADSNGATALKLAIESRHENAAVELLERKADPSTCDIYGTSPLFDACTRGFNDIVFRLIQRGADPVCKRNDLLTPLHAAASGGSLRLVLILLDAVRARGSCSLNVVDLGKRSPLYCAVRHGHIDIAQALLDAGARPDGVGIAPIFPAVHNGSEALVRLLLTHRAQPDVTPLVQDGPNSARTPLFIAAEDGNVNVVRLLLRARADPNSVSSSRAEGVSQTPLTVAVWPYFTNKAAVVRELVEAGADAAWQDERGRTAARIAASRGHVVIAAMLRDAPYAQRFRAGGIAYHALLRDVIEPCYLPDIIWSLVASAGRL